MRRLVREVPGFSEVDAALLHWTGILPDITGVIILNLALTAVGIYGVRALYFAILEEADIPFGHTGAAVGIASFAGFTPEVFMSSWMGYLLDTYSGLDGASLCYSSPFSFCPVRIYYIPGI